MKDIVYIAGIGEGAVLCDDRESAFYPVLRSVPARVKERGHDSALGDSPFRALCVRAGAWSR